MDRFFRQIVPFFLIGFLLACVTAAVIAETGCGSNAATLRTKTIRAVYDSANVAGDQLPAIAGDHADAIVKAAKSIEEGKAALAAWRAKVEHVETTRHLIYMAIATAIFLNDKPSLDGLIQTAALFSTEFAELKGAKP